jgi:hypothetical protein
MKGQRKIASCEGVKLRHFPYMSGFHPGYAGAYSPSAYYPYPHYSVDKSTSDKETSYYDLGRFALYCILGLSAVVFASVALTDLAVKEGGVPKNDILEGLVCLGIMSGVIIASMAALYMACKFTTRNEKSSAPANPVLSSQASGAASPIQSSRAPTPVSGEKGMEMNPLS